MDNLVQYQLEAGLPAAGQEIIKHGESLDEFKGFCFENWKPSLNLVDQAHRRQAERHMGPKNKWEICIRISSKLL